MTTAFTASETVDRPAAEVWAHLTSWTWLPNVAEVRLHGCDLRFRSRGRDRTARLEIAEPGRTVLVHSAQGTVSAAYTYRCDPADAGRTRLTLTADVRVRAPWRPLAPLLRYAIRRADAGQLTALKRAMEMP